MSSPTRGGADSVVFRGGSARGASMQMLDADSDSNVKRDAWFAYVMPTQTGVEMVGSGRYGYWGNRPKILAESDLIIVGDIDNEDGDGDDGQATEPVLIVTTHNAITVYVAQAKHLEAMPIPVAPVQPGV